MNYYCTNANKIEFITTDFSKTTYNTVIADNRNIPLENTVLLDGQLYDNRELDYWRKKRLSELEAYQVSVTSAPFTTSLGIRANVDEHAIIMQGLGDILSDLNGNTKSVDFVDYDGKLQQITQANYKKLVKETGNRINDLRKSYVNIKTAIMQAETIDAIKAIVIQGK